MKFGMNLLLWTDNLTEAHRPVLEMLKRQGYDGVEVPIFDLNPDKFAALGLWLDDLGLERTAVTCRGGDDNPISGDAKVRAAGVANNKLTIECCQAAGISILAGPYHSALGVFSGAWPHRRRSGTRESSRCGRWPSTPRFAASRWPSSI